MLIAPEEALGIVLRHVRPLKPRRLALSAALNCCLAEDVRSDRDQPPTDRSAMDGYAVLAADLRRVPARLRLVGEVAAGSPVGLRVRPGSCAAVLTGACIPPGADAVVPVEQTEGRGDEVVVRAAVERGESIRRRGEEASRGQVLLRKGRLLGAAEIGVCAMVGKKALRVHPQPRVAVLCTGAELRDTGERVAAHQLRDSNGPALVAALAEQGVCDVVRLIVPDEPAAIAAQVKRLARARPVVIVTGGVSVGRYDFVPEALRRAGGQVRFHGVNMKPGRPQLYATLPGNRHVFGLPGNPVSVLTGFYEFVSPALRRLRGTSRERCRPTARVRLAGPARSKGNRPYFALARLIQTPDGPAAAPLGSAGSADIIAACEADGVIVIPEGTKKLPAGALVEFHAWRTMR